MKVWIYSKLHHLFWRTLCPYPDQTRIGMWWYHHSGNIAKFFYRKAHNLKKATPQGTK